MSRLEKVTTESFAKKVFGSDQPVLVEFSTSRCPACHAVRPLLESLAEEFDGRARIFEVNVEEEQELGAAFQIRAVPTLAFFKNGEFVDGAMGAPPAPILRRKLERLSESCAPRG
jgi:thioredoxin-like negative regulator of GroEL